MNRIPTLGFLALMFASITLTGCGGGSGGGGQVAGIGGSGKVSSGSISGFGSIFVNGVEYQINNATTITVDESSGKTESDLNVGMVVTVNGTSSATTGTAASVTFDSNAEGPVSGLTTAVGGLTKTFNIFGLTARVDQSTVFDNSDPTFTFSSIADNDIVKVSGFFDNGTTGTLQVTYIEKTGTFNPANPSGTVVEIKGSVSNVSPSSGATPANGGSFDVNGITVTLDNGTTLDNNLGGVVNNSDFVEVNGILSTATTMRAIRVERENTTIGNSGDEVELEGLIAGFSTGGIGNFMIGGQAVNATNASLEPTTLLLADGLRVEVEGRIDSNGILVADKVEASGNKSIEIDATVASGGIDIANSTIVMNLINGTVPVIVDGQTSFDDKTGATSSLTLADLAGGNFLEIKGYLNTSGQVVAVEVRRDTLDDLVVQGPVDSFVANNDITILGVQFFTGGAQFKDVNDNPFPGGSTGFFTNLQVGDIVKIKDVNPSDGIADEVDQES